MTERKPRFMSLRLRLTLPVLLLVILPAAVLSYGLVVGTDADISSNARQLFALGAGLVTALVLLAVYFLTLAMTSRVKEVTRTVNMLNSGHSTARTNLLPVDEVSELGHAIDQYADYVQEKQDALRSALRRKRREVTHLLAVLESMPDGVILQDLDGRVILMNDKARDLLGSARVFRSAAFHELTAVVTDKLGPMLAPGLYALGDPQRVELDGKVLQAQAAAVMTKDSDTRLGTVVLLRDHTETVKTERSRDAMLDRLVQEVQQPIAHLARSGLIAGNRTQAGDFARELTRHAVALQKMIVELREIGTVDEITIKRTQRPIQLDMLVWAVINEWRQIAHANQIDLKVQIARRGLFVLGDERRLRWAIGNLIDNAIKYTSVGGTAILEIRNEEHNFAQLRVRDNGVGILPEEQRHIFTRFWRGTPTTDDGRVIRVPGMGQGLYIARQIIEAHGGRVEVRSKQGTGTAVYFTLPLTAAEGLELPLLYNTEMEGETMPLDTEPTEIAADTRPMNPINPTQLSSSLDLNL